MKWSILFVFLGVAFAKDCFEELEKSNAGGLLGRFTPRCNPDGTYQPMQCHEFSCFCVFKSGDEVLGTRKNGRDPINCKITDCYIQRHHALKMSSMGIMLPFAPKCEDDGTFSKLQCMKGNMCWCTDPKTGKGLKKGQFGLKEEDC